VPNRDTVNLIDLDDCVTCMMASRPGHEWEGWAGRAVPYDGERQWYGAYMVSFISICLDAPLIITARPGIYCPSQRSILIAWPLNPPDRHTISFLIDAQKGEILESGPIYPLTTRSCSRRRCIYPIVLTPIRRLPDVSWTRIGP